MTDQGIFKSSVFGGFDRQSVLTYVDDQARRFKDREDQLQKRTRELEEELETLGEEKKHLTDQVRQLTEKVEQYMELEQNLSERDARVARLEEELAAAGREREEMMQRVSQGDEKGRKYDAIASQVGIVMVEAQKQGDTIVARAHQQAERVAQESVSNIYELNKRVDAFKDDMYRLHAFSVQTLQALDQKMAQIDLLVKQAEGHLYISAGNAEMQSEVYIQEEYMPGTQPAIPVQAEGVGGEDDFFTEPYQG